MGLRSKAENPPSSATPSDKGTEALVPGDMFFLGLLQGRQQASLLHSTEHSDVDRRLRVL